MRRIRLDKLPIYDSSRSVIDLEEFQVWAPDAKIVVHGDHGINLENLSPPPMRFFRGLVNGDPESFAYFSMDPSGRDVQGLIVTRDKKFAVASQRRPGARGPRREGESMDTFLTEFDDGDAAQSTGETWHCDVDKLTYAPRTAQVHATGAGGLPVTENGISGSQAYAIKVDIETDFELYQNAGSSVTTLTNYITNLTGAVSTIYNRDLKTNVTQGNVDIYTTSSDPWAATDPNSGLTELGDYIHTHPSTASDVVFLSGKPIGGGVAWEGIVCGSEFTYQDAMMVTHYGGPYAWCGGIGNLGTTGLGTIPDPNATTGGILYGMPSAPQTYWPLAEYAHELGHNLAGHHTQCVAITSGEFASAGFTDGTVESAATDFVDHCYGHDGSGCYGGVGGTADYVPGSQGSHLGTIMSYCHNVFIAGVPQSRFTFGQAGEPSHHELDDYMLNAAGPLAPFEQNVVTGVGAFTMSSFSSPSSVGPNSTGNTATISANGTATYAWTISNGSITAGASSATVTFTAAASGTVVLRGTVYGTNRCGVTDTKSIAINSLPALTGVDAHTTTGSNVQISWSGSCSTTCHVYRSRFNDYTTFDLAGSGTSPFNDTGVASGKAYVYKVRAFDGTTESPDSNLDLAYVHLYANAPAAGVTVTALDTNETRDAVDAVRGLVSSLTAGSYTFGSGMPLRVTNADTIHKVDIDEMRSNLDAAYSVIFPMMHPTYTNTTITATVSTIQAVDFTEIRNWMR